MKKGKLLIVALIAVIMSIGLYVSCDLSLCPRSDDCKYEYWCGETGCDAKYDYKCDC